MHTNAKRLTTLAMLAALSYLIMVVGRIPIVLFLKYEAKDVIIAMGGFIFGPLAALAISATVSLIEMFTVSDTGIIGAIMNMVSTCSFVCTAALIYKKNHTLKGAVLGLVIGTIFMTGVMLLWNYLLTPIYMGYPREAVAAMLVPAFLPFNLLKGGLNTALTLLLYKPVVQTLRKIGLAPRSISEGPEGKISIGLMLGAALLLITCILLALVLAGVL